MASYCKCMFDYEACDSDELALSEGNIVEITDDSEEGWWHGKCKGKVGMFPSNFVERITVAEAHAALGIVSTTPPQPIRKAAASVRRPSAAVEMAQADFSYDAQDDDELSFAEKDVVSILDKNPGTDGWWKVSLSGKIGLVPDNFFHILGRGEEPLPAAAVPKSEPTPISSISSSARGSMSDDRPPAAVPSGSAAGRPLPAMGSAVVAGLAGLRKTAKPPPAAAAPAKPEQAPAPVVPDWRANLKKRPPTKQATTDEPVKETKEVEDAPKSVGAPSWMKKRATGTEPGLQPSTSRTSTTEVDAVDIPKPAVEEAKKPSPSWMKKKMTKAEPVLEDTRSRSPSKEKEQEPVAAPAEKAAPWKKPESGEKPPPANNRFKPSGLRSRGSSATISHSRQNSVKASESASSSISYPPSRASLDKSVPESTSNADVRSLQDTVNALLGRVGAMELQMVALQKTVNDLDDDIIAEKKLRSACEVELETIRKRLRD